VSAPRPRPAGGAHRRRAANRPLQQRPGAGGPAAVAADVQGAPTLEAAPAEEEVRQRPRSRKLGRAEREARELLEWPALCRQVACFARTPMAAELAAAGKLPMGRDQADSEQLLAQTREAGAAPLDFGGVFDLRRAVDAAEQGLVLHPLVLGAVATTLGGARRLRAATEAAGAGGAALRALARGIGAALPELQAEIERCVQVGPANLHFLCV
jgi:hypothetical protein